MALRIKDRIEGNIRQSDKVNNSLSIQLNNGATTVYDGSSAKAINITANSIGAIPAASLTTPTVTWNNGTGSSGPILQIKDSLNQSSNSAAIPLDSRYVVKTDIDGFVSIDLVNSENGSVPTTNADALGGLAASNYAKKTDLNVYAQASTLNNYAQKSELNNYTLKTDLLNAIYPVGSIYMSVNSTSPAILFGGTWEQIQGRFLLSADSSYVAGSTGGAATVNLNSSNIPSHNHSVNITTTSNGSHTHNLKSISYDGQTVQFFNADSSGGSWVGDTQFMLAAKRNLGNVSGVNHVLTVNNLMTGNPINSGGSHSHTVSGNTGSSGSGTAHDNMPPYLAVYTWKRTA